MIEELYKEKGWIISYRERADGNEEEF